MKRTKTLIPVAVASVAAAFIAPSVGHAADVDAGVQNGTLRVSGGSGNDNITLRLRAGDPSTVEVDGDDDGSADASFDRSQFTAIVVSGGSGNDVLRISDANGTFTDTEITTLDGGSGNDTFIGGGGAETYLGGSGNDRADGNRGNDLGIMGSGNDSFTWDPGDGNDVIEGDSGQDTMIFNGAGGAETFDLSANGGRLRFFRQPGNVLMDTNNLEIVVVNALGSSDVITVNDLTGTDVRLADVDLGGALGASGGDGAVDTVIVNGTNGDDDVTVSGDDPIRVQGLVPTVEISDAEANDQLRIETLAGNDDVDTDALAPGSIAVLVDGSPL